MKVEIIFIMGSERTGSNLLRKLLCHHSSLDGPIPPHLLKIFSKNERQYFALEDGRKLLYEDMRNIANYRRNNWGIDLDFAEFQLKFQTETFLDYFNGFYSMMLDKTSATRIVCKENNIFDHALELKEYFGDRARFIYLHRDPRDVAASWMQVPLGIEDPLVAARNWVTEQEKCLSLLGDKTLAVQKVSYECLVAETAATVDNLLHQLGLPVDNACHSTSRLATNSAESGNEYFRNLDQPIMKSNFEKFRRAFDQVTLFEIESIVLNEMTTLGYTPVFNHGKFEKCWFQTRRKLQPYQAAKFKRMDFDDYNLELMQDWMSLVKKTQSKFEGVKPDRQPRQVAQS